jgi:HEAT repeat protein
VEEIEALLVDLTSGNDQRAEKALSHLAQMGEVAFESLLELLDSPDPDHRWWAVRSLSHINNPLAGENLHRALSDSDLSVRYCAALSLRFSPFPEAIPTLIEALESTDRLFARLASDALTAVGEEAIPALAEALRSTTAASRGEAARALAKMQNPKALSVLYEAIDDPSSIVQHWVEDGFERLGVGIVFFKP